MVTPISSAGDRMRARAEVLDELEKLRGERARALREADQALDSIEDAARRAVELGLSLAEVSEVASVSRPTLYARGVRRPAA